MISTRTEKIRLKASLDKAGADRHAGLILQTKFDDAFSHVREGDTFTVDYTFTAEYFGEVERHLRLFEALLADPELVVGADVEELSHGESILVGLVEQIGRIKAQIEAKKTKEARTKLLESISASLQPEGFWAKTQAETQEAYVVRETRRKLEERFRRELGPPEASEWILTPERPQEPPRGLWARLRDFLGFR